MPAGGYDERVKQLEELAFIDQSADYETDYNGIYYDKKAPAGKRFVLIQAAGCS